MSAPADLAREMQGIGAAIRHARAEIEAGRLIDVASLDARTGALCTGLAEVPAGGGAALRPAVLALIDDFAQLARLIDDRLGALRGDLKELAGRGQALSAYGKAARPDKPRR